MISKQEVMEHASKYHSVAMQVCAKDYLFGISLTSYWRARVVVREQSALRQPNLHIKNKFQYIEKYNC